MCTIKNCDRKTHARNMCKMHYKRWLRTGNPEVRSVPNFKGNDVGYLAIHIRLTRLYGKASSHLCIQCLGPASEWALIDNINLKVDTVDQRLVRYSTNLSDYAPMCSSHHRIYDAPLAQ